MLLLDGDDSEDANANVENKINIFKSTVHI
jgi:hypothetical protein